VGGIWRKEMKIISLIGKRFDRLVVVKKEPHESGENIRWLCRCDCGKEVVVIGCNLKSGHTKSCGCLNSESRVKSNTTHGLSKTRVFHIYNGMKSRCYNPNEKSYKHYGGKGITICDEWIRDFCAFYDWSMKNGYESGLTIDRIDTGGNYEPSNCRWSSYKVQENNRSNNRKITIEGRTQTLTEWAEESGIDARLLHARIKRLGWSVEDAVKKPVKRFG
jgi:hypothetical protein